MDAPFGRLAAGRRPLLPGVGRVGGEIEPGVVLDLHVGCDRADEQ